MMILIDSNHHDDDYNDGFCSYYPMRVPIIVDRNLAVGACYYVSSSFLPVDFVYDHRYQNYHEWATVVPTAFDLVADADVVVDVDDGHYYHEEEDDVTVVLVETCSLISPLLRALY